MLSGKMKKWIAGVLTAVMAVTAVPMSAQPLQAAETKTASIKYVEKMGSGWNLGNRLTDSWTWTMKASRTRVRSPGEIQRLQKN